LANFRASFSSCGHELKKEYEGKQIDIGFRPTQIKESEIHEQIKLKGREEQ